MQKVEVYFLSVNIKILVKIPNTYFNEIEQIVNERTNYSEKRLLMITDFFFLIFSFESGYLSSYNNIKLVFWASIRSIFGMKNTEKMFQFEFSKTDNTRIFLYFNTIQGAKIMDIVLENLRKIGIDYSINKGKPSNNLIEENKENSNAKNEAKLLPKLEVLDNNENSNTGNNNKDENKKENNNDKEKN